VTSLEDRVRRLEDRFEINDLLVSYAVLLDDRQFESVGRLFTEDGVFASPNSTTHGRSAIAANFEAKHAPFTMTLHDPHASSLLFTGPDEARGTVLGYAELANGEHTIITNIRYQDDYRREAGAWRFARRHVLSVYGMTVSDFVSGRAGDAERKRWPGRPVGPAECPDVEQRFPGYLVQP
jgi:ketosteroid isomerase-like protein